MLKEMYVAGYVDEVYTVILDEMNLSRVEYYFAEMLSILEMPNRDEWIIELVPNSWKTDPKKIIGGKIKVPADRKRGNSKARSSARCIKTSAARKRSNNSTRARNSSRTSR